MLERLGLLLDLCESEAYLRGIEIWCRAGGSLQAFRGLKPTYEGLKSGRRGIMVPWGDGLKPTYEGLKSLP